MISMDIIATNHKHSRILAQTSLCQRPKKDGREVQASISPFASMTFHPSIACRTALMSQKEAALPNTGGFERYTNRLGKRSNLRHRILHTISYTMYYYVKANSLPTSPNTWMISTQNLRNMAKICQNMAKLTMKPSLLVHPCSSNIFQHPSQQATGP